VRVRERKEESEGARESESKCLAVDGFPRIRVVSLQQFVELVKLYSCTVAQLHSCTVVQL